MTPITASGENRIRSDPIFTHYNPDAFGKMLMNESISQPSGVSYAARTKTIKSNRTDCGLEEGDKYGFCRN